MWWSVLIEMVGDDTQDAVTVEQLEELADRLEPLSASVGGAGDHYSARLSVDVTPDQLASDVALAEFTKARDEAGLPAWPLVHLEMMTEERLDAELAKPTFPDVVGVAEAAKMLSVSKQRLIQLADRPDFPAPMVRLAAGPVWLRSSIRAFARRWPRKPGRPAKSAQPSKPDASAAMAGLTAMRQAASAAQQSMAPAARAARQFAAPMKRAASGSFKMPDAKTAKAAKAARGAKTAKTSRGTKASTTMNRRARRD